MNTLRCLCAGLGLLVYGTSVHAGVASLKDKWASPQLKACFFGGTPVERERIAAIASEWLPETGLALDFGAAPDFRSCSPSDKQPVRISFGSSFSWSYVGADALSVEAGKPTVSFPPMDSAGNAKEFRRMVLHEFGHVFGLLHQEQDPSSPCKVENALSASFPYQFSADLKQVVADNGKYLASRYDRTSIMRLLIYPEMLRQGENSPCYAPPTYDISAEDRQLLASLYPPRPKDVSSQRLYQTTSVVLDGALSQENFQYLLPPLKRSGIISMRRYVDSRGLTLAGMLVDDKVLPTSAVSKDFEKFLCNENRHICSRSGANVVWRNQRASKNTSTDAAECGSPKLDKSVICFPNVTFELERIPVEVRLNPSQMSLREFVVQRLKGCDVWDEACERLVRAYNPKLSNRYIRPGGLFKAEELTLTLPAATLRLPLEYTSDSDHRKITEIVERVRARRANELDVDESDIAIRLVEPVGNPRPQAASQVLSEPVQGYEKALLTMGYPFADEAGDTILESFYPVDVAIWDTRVDAIHCEFMRDSNSIISTTLAGTAPLDAAPDRANSCGLARDGKFHPSLRWEHGTQVAGLIAAQVNRKGIAGVNPKARLWSWELIDGDQLNKGDDPFREPIVKYRHNAAVVNISQTFDVKSSEHKNKLESILFGSGQRAGAHNLRLIVAAAGTDSLKNGVKEGKRVDDMQTCVYFPACWSNTDVNKKPHNLVSVVALNATGDGLLKIGEQAASNFGEAFDVSAIGQVTSTMFGDWIGTVQGSSFATGYVTGLASLLIGKATSLNFDITMAALKERILATADDDTINEGSLSRFGRINYGRALGFENDVVILKKSVTACTQCIVQGMANRTRNTTFQVSYVPFKDAPPTSKPLILQNIRRLYSRPDGTLVIYYSESGRLLRMDSVTPNSAEDVVMQDGRRIPLQAIEDYTACSFREGCSSR